MKLKQEKLSLKKTRFDLEQALMHLWSTDEDVKAIFEHFSENYENISVDQHANVLLGLQELIHIRGQRAFDIFEQLVKQRDIK